MSINRVISIVVFKNRILSRFSLFATFFPLTWLCFFPPTFYYYRRITLVNKFGPCYSTVQNFRLNWNIKNPERVIINRCVDSKLADRRAVQTARREINECGNSTKKFIAIAGVGERLKCHCRPRRRQGFSRVYILSLRWHFDCHVEWRDYLWSLRRCIYSEFWHVGNTRLPISDEIK